MEAGNESSNYFDYIIIGSGLAGLHVAMQMEKDSFFSNKKIAIFDKVLKETNDKTYCFWEQGTGTWDPIISNSWTKTTFKDSKNNLKIDLDPYTYKKIDSLDFYNHCLKKLKTNNSFSFFTEEIYSIKESDDSVTIRTSSNKNYNCKHVFDSRLEVPVETIKKETAFVSQSFKGWFIKTSKPTFNENTFTMMDYSHRWENSTSFMYILPKSNTEALLEYTFFAPYIITDNDFDNQIASYIKNNFLNTQYEITEVEKGVIPMTTYNFKKHNSSRTTKIGTAGGWVKASTGYSFKFAEKNAINIIDQLKKGEQPIGTKSPKRFTFYDNLFLKILAYENKKGPNIFLNMYQNTSPKLLFSFLDEETSLYQEIKIISKLPYLPFIKAIFKK